VQEIGCHQAESLARIGVKKLREHVERIFSDLNDCLPSLPMLWENIGANSHPLVLNFLHHKAITDGKRKRSRQGQLVFNIARLLFPLTARGNRQVLGCACQAQPQVKIRGIRCNVLPYDRVGCIHHSFIDLPAGSRVIWRNYREPIHQVGLHVRPAKNALPVREDKREDDLDLGGSSGLQGRFKA